VCLVDSLTVLITLTHDLTAQVQLSHVLNFWSCTAVGCRRQPVDQSTRHMFKYWTCVTCDSQAVHATHQQMPQRPAAGLKVVVKPKTRYKRLTAAAGRHQLPALELFWLAPDLYSHVCSTPSKPLANVRSPCKCPQSTVFFNNYMFDVCGCKVQARC
jgi:hypothetical protein